MASSPMDTNTFSPEQTAQQKATHEEGKKLGPSVGDRMGMAYRLQNLYIRALYQKYAECQASSLPWLLEYPIINDGIQWTPEKIELGMFLRDETFRAQCEVDAAVDAYLKEAGYRPDDGEEMTHSPYPKLMLLTQYLPCDQTFPDRIQIMEQAYRDFIDANLHNLIESHQDIFRTYFYLANLLSNKHLCLSIQAHLEGVDYGISRISDFYKAGLEGWNNDLDTFAQSMQNMSIEIRHDESTSSAEYNYIDSP